MDMQRNILVVALLIIGWLMFVTYQNDYGAGATSSNASTTASTAAKQPATTQAPQAGSTTPSSDLSGLASAGTTAPSASVVATENPAAGPVVSIKTDVLDLDINLEGGDITRLVLPRFPASLNAKANPVRLMSTGDVTYIAQSGLVSAIGPDYTSNSKRSVYIAAANHFEMDDGQQALDVVLSLPPVNGVTIEKVFHFTRGDYLVGVSYRVRNESTAPWSGFMFGQIKRDSSGDPAHPGGNSLFSGSSSYLGAAYRNDLNKYNKLPLKDLEKKPIDKDKEEVTGGWIAFIQHYFVSAWIPEKQDKNKFFAKVVNGTYFFGFTSPEISVAPGTSGEVHADFYAGPKLQDRLKEISNGLDLTADYGWFWFISQPLLWLLIHIEKIVGNWGVAIILLTVLVKLVFYYPSHVSYRSMAQMRRVTPELTRLREEFKDDRQKQAQEMMNLYRKEKINPLGGCLPIVVQMPVFIALYWALLESVELRQAPFMLWIHDLSVQDPYFVLPLLMGASMFVQTRLNPAPPDPMQAKILQWMPVIFTAFFLFFPAGLVLYWLVNNLLSIAQQWFITRQIEKQYGKPA